MIFIRVERAGWLKPNLPCFFPYLCTLFIGGFLGDKMVFFSCSYHRIPNQFQPGMYVLYADGQGPHQFMSDIYVVRHINFL